MDYIFATYNELETVIEYIKFNPKISDEGEALIAYLSKYERNLQGK